MKPEQPDALETYSLLAGVVLYFAAIGYSLYTVFSSGGTA